MSRENDVFDLLKELEIPFELHTHPPVFTVEEANRHWENISGLHCKNIFLRNKKGNLHYLVILPSDKLMDIKKLGDSLGERLSFASPERLMRYLGLTPGAVSPFGLINDVQKEVHVILDKDIFEAEKVNFHPNVNTATITISSDDFLKFIRKCGNKTMHLAF